MVATPGSAHPGTASELSYLFYELGNVAAYDVAGNPLSGWGLKNTGPFSDIQAGSGDTYWIDLPLMPSDSPLTGYFNFYYGSQSVSNSSHRSGYAWAVRDGDVGVPVPEPGTMLLLGVGLAGVAVARKKLRK